MANVSLVIFRVVRDSTNVDLVETLQTALEPGQGARGDGLQLAEAKRQEPARHEGMRHRDGDLGGLGGEASAFPSHPASPPRTDCRLVRHVARATRPPWGLPCSTRSCHYVPSLLPRRSASVHRLSTFPKRVAFAYFVEARPPQFLTRLRLGSLRATARRFAAVDLPVDSILAPLLLDTSRRHAGSQATLSLSAYRGGLLSSHKERAAFTAHTKSY